MYGTSALVDDDIVVPLPMLRAMARLPCERRYWMRLSSRKRRMNASTSAEPSVVGSFRHLIAIGSSSPAWCPRYTMLKPPSPTNLSTRNWPSRT
jgi:hypothetical protein